MIKIIKNYKRVLAKLNHNFKNYHLLSVEKSSQDKFDFKKNLKEKISDKFITRLSNYAKYLKDNEPKEKKNDLWTVVAKERNHEKFINTVCEAKNNKDNFMEAISNCGKSNLLHGFGPNRYSYKDLTNKKVFRKKEKLDLLDYLLSLSEYYKIIKVYNPEQGGWVVEKEDFDNLINQIFKKKKISIFKTPNFYFGYKFQKEFLFPKDFKGLHTAERLSDIYKKNNLLEVAEIGGGAGYTCHYFRQLIDSTYSIYDLPYTSLLQAIYLMMSLGEDSIHLGNEKINNKKKVFIKPYWKIFDHKNNKKILWFNEDSFPEIDFDLSKKYIKKIFKSKKSFLLSINQEARNNFGTEVNQHTVYDLIHKHQRIYRSRDFLRPGYIEELIEIKN